MAMRAEQLSVSPPSVPDGERSHRSVARLARQLARRVADAADADLVAIALVGVSGMGPADFEEPVPRALLEALNDGRPARYRITLVLQADGRDLGILRLGSIRPRGFTDENVESARQMADEAATVLARRLDEPSWSQAARGRESAPVGGKQPPIKLWNRAHR
jgi:hypothetical protein